MQNRFPRAQEEAEPEEGKKPFFEEGPREIVSQGSKKKNKAKHRKSRRSHFLKRVLTKSSPSGTTTKEPDLGGRCVVETKRSFLIKVVISSRQLARATVEGEQQ